MLVAACQNGYAPDVEVLIGVTEENTSMPLLSAMALRIDIVLLTEYDCIGDFMGFHWINYIDCRLSFLLVRAAA